VTSSGNRSRLIAVILLAAALLVVALAARPAFTYLRAAALLLRIEDPHSSGILANIHNYSVEELPTQVPTPSGMIRARLYSPRGIASPPGLVIVHGVHHLGIEEPRLVAFARAMSSSGIRVLTPELASLADYHVDTQSIDVIGYSARSMATSLGQKVGLLGISFGGGLSLLAASEPQFEPYVSFVVSVGAHDDLERVAQFFVTNRIARPDGTTLEMTAHEYGPLILIYSHIEDFFPAADVNTVHDVLQQLLWEKADESRKLAAQLSPASRRKMELLYEGHVQALAGEMTQSIARHRQDMAPVSPHGRLGALHVPVFLLHGSEDNIIPPSELLWLEQDVPRADLKAALISPVISHVSMNTKPPFSENLRLVRFMAGMLELADERQFLQASKLPDQPAEH